MFASAYIESQPRLLSAPASVRILAVGVQDTDYRELTTFLAEPDCTVYRAAARHDARRLVHTIAPDVVLCEPGLPDGTWRELLSDLQDHPRSPKLIVCSLLADDRLWAEVLNIGGYDVLMKPFHPVEVVRVVRMAARHVHPTRIGDCV